MSANESTGPVGEQGRIDHIDSLRALAAMYVTLHHALLYVNDDLAAGLARKFIRLFLFGHFAVVLFIVLSGFCLMRPVIRRDGVLSGGAWHFLRKRAWRILPPYYAAIAVSLTLIWLVIGTPTGSIWDGSIPVTFRDFICHLLMIQDWFEVVNHGINYPLWTISVEWRIYFLFPLLVYCWNRFGALKTVAVTVVSSLLLLIPLESTFFNTSVNGVCLHYYGLFALGMLAAGLTHPGNAWLQKVRGKIPWGALFIAMCALIMLLFKAEFWLGIALPWQCTDLFGGIAAMAFLIAVAPSGKGDNLRVVRKVLNWQPLVLLGTFSYSFYLLHAPLLQVIWQYGLRPFKLSPLLELFVLCFAGVPVIIGLSYLFHLVCERPFMKPPNMQKPLAHGLGMSLRTE